MLRVAIVAGEQSGDILGSELIQALKQIRPDIAFMGIGGPRMMREGCESLFSMERLSLMGLVEVASSLFGLLKLRRNLVKQILAWQPDIFIGIDAPDFNLGLERKLKRAGIPTVHYVSPNVWAWRPYRVKKIGESVDLMLSLFPFEPPIYANANVKARFVGHPLADKIELQGDRRVAEGALGIPEGRTVIAILPGSRTSEIRKLTPVFLDAATMLSTPRADCHFLFPFPTQTTADLFVHEAGAQLQKLSHQIVIDDSHTVMRAARVGLIASGTAALEALFMKLPMVVAYRLNWLSYQVVKRLVTVPWVSLPNVLAGKELVPELLQHEATVKRIVHELNGLLDDIPRRTAIIEQFDDIHRTLRIGSGERAAIEVLSLLEENTTHG